MQIPKPDAVNETDYRMYTVIAVVGGLGTLVHILLIPFFFWIGAYGLSAFNVFSATIWGWSVYVSRRGKHHWALSALTLEAYVHAVLAVSILGLKPGFQNYLWGGAAFVLFNDRWGMKMLITTTCIYAITYASFNILAPDIPYRYNYPDMINSLHFANALIAFIGLALSCFYFRSTTLRMEKRMARLAQTDPLTGLSNRRHMLTSLERERGSAQRAEYGITLLLGDVDHFKRINDQFGHDVGDMVLRELADRLSSRLRKNDLLARWGGEEFLIALTLGTEGNREQTAEALRQLIADTPFHCNDHLIPVTISFGLVHLNPTETLEAAIKRADIAMYKAKATGRNRVWVSLENAHEESS
ncbi:GGDEF domain-containing protein [Burkholderiaceae bacterium DAT-1]|nr:GGDEF domain-containing protein [Burkholderiaceae bacterium DAT-1]